MPNRMNSAQRKKRKVQNEMLLQQGLYACSACDQVLSIDSFSPYGKAKPGYPYPQCKDCVRKRMNESNRRKAIIKHQMYRQECDLCDRPFQADRSTQRFCCIEHRLFAWTVAQHHGEISDARHLFHIDKCEICGESKNLCIDHSHSTGKWRGRLCGTCNTALGHFADQIDSIQNAINYLNSEPPKLPDIVAKSSLCRWCHQQLGDVHANRIYCSTQCKRRANDVAEKFHITSYQYQWMLNQQDRCCPCCRKILDFTVIDHCHEKGHVRGLLCFNCNVALGQVRDSVPILENMLNYLKQKI